MERHGVSGQFVSYWARQQSRIRSGQRAPRKKLIANELPGNRQQIDVYLDEDALDILAGKEAKRPGREREERRPSCGLRWPNLPRKRFATFSRMTVALPRTTSLSWRVGAAPAEKRRGRHYGFMRRMTSREFDKDCFDKKSGKIGEHAGASYYLLYTPNGNDGRALDLEWLRAAAESDKNKRLAVYCEKLWVHRDDLAKFEKESGKSVRPMLVPFSLR